MWLILFGVMIAVAVLLFFKSEDLKRKVQQAR